MKKVIKLIFVLVIMLGVSGVAYGATSCNINLQCEKNELNKNEEFIVYANIVGLKSDDGIISFGGTLQYDKESLELKSIEGQNKWETPEVNYGYNEANGKIVITRSSPTTTDGAMLKFTFKVKETSKSNPVITLKDMTVGDGVVPVNVTVSNIRFTVKEGTENKVPDPGVDTPTPDNGNNGSGTTTPDNGNKPSSGTDNSNNNAKNELKITQNVAKDKKLPQTGSNDYIILLGIVGLILVAAGIFIKIQIMNKKR